jgi:hypothetical protein
MRKRQIVLLLAVAVLLAFALSWFFGLAELGRP